MPRSLLESANAPGRECPSQSLHIGVDQVFRAVRLPPQAVPGRGVGADGGQGEEEEPRGEQSSSG